MADHNILSQHLDRHAIGSWIAERRDIWQMDLLDADKLADFCKKRGVTFWEKHILQLWRAGLLQADVVVADKRIYWSGFSHVGANEYGQHLYADERVLKPRATGWQRLVARASNVPAHITPHFHPFRYFVLFHLQRVLDPPIVPMQTLIAPARYHEMLDLELKWIQQWSGTQPAAEISQYWNDVASLAMLTEPCMYERVFGTLKWPARVTQDQQRKRIAEHWEDVRRLYADVSLDQLEEIRNELAWDAHLLDSNVDVQTLICMVRDESRLKREGQLGGALVVRTMGEVIRRAAEQIFDTKLKEEDEMGRFSFAPADLKERRYDSERILDGDPNAIKEFLRHFGIRPDTELRWYVEGDTEYFALKSFFGDSSRVKLVNLRGSVSEKNGAGVAFRESLRADVESHVFSFVSIDEDVGRNASAVRKAAEKDELCGAFFISSPDFEFANFTLDELEAVLWSLAQEKSVPNEVHDKLHEALQGAATGEELMKRATKILHDYMGTVSKGETWGAALMDYALAHPERECEGRKETRYIIEMIRMAISTHWADFVYQKREYCVDPETGLLVPRSLKREERAAHIKSNFPWYTDVSAQRQRLKNLSKR